MQPIIVYCTFESVAEAEKIGMILLEKRLVACVKMIEKITSMFWWQGKINKATEAMFILESTDELYDEIVKVISENHSYSTPVITMISVDKSTEKVMRWLEEETGKQRIKD